MAKILIASDTHGRIGALIDAIYDERPNTVIHLGDCSDDAEDISRLFPSLNLCFVRGNNEYAPTVPEEAFFLCEGVPVFAAHGHRFAVKSGTSLFAAAARKRGARLALFGHTHSPFLSEENELTVLNPGACGSDGSYAVAEISNGKIISVKLLKQDQD